MRPLRRGINRPHTMRYVRRYYLSPLTNTSSMADTTTENVSTSVSHPWNTPGDKIKHYNKTGRYQEDLLTGSDQKLLYKMLPTFIT